MTQLGTVCAAVMSFQLCALQIAPVHPVVGCGTVTQPEEEDAVPTLVLDDAVAPEPETLVEDVAVVVAAVELLPLDGAEPDVVELEVLEGTDVDCGELVSALLEPPLSGCDVAFDVPHADCPRAARPTRRPCPQRRE